MVTDPTERVDASNIAPRLWMGGRPPFDRDMPKVDMLVLAARELQPPTLAFHGLLVRCPLVDDHLEQTSIARALVVGHAVAQAIASGKTALVTCSQGRNRSGLIVGFALGHLTKLTGDDIIDLIRRRRVTDGTLSNPAFRDYLRKYIDPSRGTLKR